jgi:hypothetical protein
MVFLLVAAVAAQDVIRISAPHHFWPSGWEPPPPRRLQVSEEARQALLEKHNALRAQVDTPCTAADMMQLAWDDTLAAESQAYAEQCVWAHDTERNQANGWGENLAMSTESSFTTDTLTNFVQMWYEEVVDADWTDAGIVPKVYASLNECQSPDSEKCQIGHYTQVVWAATTHVGCGVAQCGDGWLMGAGGVYLVCKYSPPGNLGGPGGLTPAYLQGSPCATCGDACLGGSLCAVGSAPNRCADQTAFSMGFNGVTYTDCASITGGVGSWCSDYHSQFPFCPLTCGACAVPEGLGSEFCGGSETSEGAGDSAPAPPATSGGETASSAWRSCYTLFFMISFCRTLLP